MTLPNPPKNPTQQQAQPQVNFIDLIKYARFIPLVIQIVSAVQAAMGPGNGEQKKAAALKALAAALAIVEGIAEKDLLDDAAFLALADRLIELAVSMLKLQPEVESIAGRIRALRPA
jgi:hypothetical protein